MTSLLADARYAVRGFRATPGFTIAALITLTLGIGANTAIFTILNTVLIERLPYPEPDRIFTVTRFGGGAISEPVFSYIEKNNTVFEDLAAYHSGASMNLAGGEEPELVETVTASNNYFHLFGAKPIVGRVFTPAEDAPRRPRVLVISYGLWQRRFGGDPAILGQAIVLGGAPSTVVGVLSPGFQSPSERLQQGPHPSPDVWMPLQADLGSTNEAGTLTVSGRLPDGIALAEANARMTAVARGYSSRTFRRDPAIQITPLKRQITAGVRPALFMLLAAVSLVLLLACANVANLMLARGSVCEQEIAIRAALGAGRRRIVRQLLIESSLLALAGGAFGLVLGSWGVRALLAFAPSDLPRVREMAANPALDPHVAGFTLLLAIAIGVLFGLIPALQLSRTDLNAAFKNSGARAGNPRRRTRGFLVAAEAAISVVLLCGAILLIRSFAALHNVNPGFDSSNLLTMQISLAGPGFSRSRDVDGFTRQFVERAEQVPGVQSAAVASAMPLFGLMDMIFDIPGGAPQPGAQFTGDVQWRFVSSHYFDVLRIPVISGRALRDNDRARTVVVNRAMARRYWPGANPVGRSVLIGPGLGPLYREGVAEIVGIVGDVRDRLDADPYPIMYQLPSQIPDADIALLNGYESAAVLIRTRPGVAPMAVRDGVERVLRAGNSLAVAKVRTMAAATLDSTAARNFELLLIGMFAAGALLLAATGIYSVVSYSVEQRTRELGLRAALGASRIDTLTLVMTQNLNMAMAGIVCGIAASFGLARLIRAQLFGVTPSDPLTFIAAPAILLAVAVVAAYVPARKAARVDPAEALRHV